MLDTIIAYIGPAGIVLLPVLAVLAVATIVQEIHDHREGRDDD